MNDGNVTVGSKSKAPRGKPCASGDRPPVSSPCGGVPLGAFEGRSPL